MVIIYRLFSLQIKDFKTFSKLSEQNATLTVKILAPRGKIFDRNGLILATNEKKFRILLFSNKKDEIENALSILKKIIPQNINQSPEDILKKSKLNTFHMCILAQDLSWNDMTKIEETRFAIPNIFIDQINKRFYSKSKECAHLIGYVDQNGDSKSGIEKMFSLKLTGQQGKHMFEVDSRRNIRKFIDTSHPIPGENIHITIDRNIQSKIYEKLSENTVASSAVMLNERGEIVASCSYPSFDPTNLDTSLKDRHLSPMLNRAFSGLYMPGSLIKMCVGLAALNYDKISSSTRIQCNGFIEVGNHKFHCWREHGHGLINLEEAIAGSCDVFFYTVGQMLGTKKISEYLRIFGINERFQNIPELKVGVLPDERAARYSADTILASIGQGYCSTTCLHLCTMMVRLITNQAICPSLTKIPNDHTFQSLNIKVDDMQTIYNGMYHAFNSPIGTAKSYKDILTNVELIGKTTTTQVAAIKRDAFGNKLSGQHTDWHMRDHSMCASSAEINGMQHVLCIISEHGGWGRFSAYLSAKIFKSILNE